VIGLEWHLIDACIAGLKKKGFPPEETA